MSPLHSAPEADQQADRLVNDLCQAATDASAALRSLRAGGGISAAKRYRKVLASLSAANSKTQIILWELEKSQRATGGRILELLRLT